MAATKFEQLTRKLDVFGIDAYTDVGQAKKEAYLKNGKAWLRLLAEKLGLTPAQYELRVNRGGIAVSGEVTLHSDTLYLQLFESCIGGRGVSVLYRSCHGRADYTGGANHEIAMAALKHANSMDLLIRECTQLGQIA